METIPAIASDPPIATMKALTTDKLNMPQPRFHRNSKLTKALMALESADRSGH